MVRKVVDRVGAARVGVPAEIGLVQPGVGVGASAEWANFARNPPTLFLPILLPHIGHSDINALATSV